MSVALLSTGTPAPVGSRSRSPQRTRYGVALGFVDPDEPPIPPSGHAWLLSWLLVAALGAVVVSPRESSLAVWWPATFVAVGVLLQAPRRRWPALLPVIALVIAGGQILAARDAALSSALGAVTAMESLAIAWALQRLGASELRSVGDVGRLLLADAAGAVTFAAGLAAIMPLIPDADYLSLLGQTTLSHITGALCLGPLFLTRTIAPHRPSREQAAQWLLLITAELWVFFSGAGPGTALILLPVLLWGAVQQSPRVAAIQSTTVAAIAVLLFSYGRSPFDVGPGAPYDDWPAATLALQLFLSTLALTSLVVATASARQRAAVEDAVRESRFTSTVLGTSDAIVIVVALDGSIELINTAGERATGWSSEELVGRKIWDAIMPCERREDIRRGFEQVEAGMPASFSEEQELLTRDGEVRLVRLAVSPLVDGDGPPRALVGTAIDVTDERRTGELLSRMLQNSSSSAAIVVRLDGRISLFSRGAADLLGCDPEEMLGTGFTARIVHGSCDGQTLVDPGVDPAMEMSRLCEQSGRGSEASARDWWWRTAAGELVAVSQTLDVVTDGSDRATGWLVIGRDATEKRRSQEIILAALRREREAVERLRTLDQAKNEFVTTVSHEPRTPVSSIVGYSEIIRDEPAAEEFGPMIDSIARNGYRLRDLADALVTLSDLDGPSPKEREPVDVVRIVLDVIEGTRSEATARGLAIRLSDETPAAEAWVHGDADDLALAITNVLGNALKFSDDRSDIDVTVRDEPDGLRIKVADRGIGIPEDEVDKVFERFHRARNAHRQAIQGPGLGLSLTDAVVRMHGGSVTLRSSEGRGTEVDIVLPRGARAAEPSGAVDG